MDSVKVLVIWVDGSTSYEKLEGENLFSQIEDLIGGPAESFYYTEGTICYGETAREANEDVHELATEIINELSSGATEGGYLYGPVVVTGVEDEEGNVTSVMKEFADDLIRQSNIRIGG